MKRVRAIRHGLLGVLGSMIILSSFFIGSFAALIPRVNGALGDWWDTNWKFRKAITIYHTAVSGQLMDFPMVIVMIDSDLINKAQNDGDDIVFTDQDGTKLNHEIEHYNNTLGHLTAWVNIPTLTSTADTIIYMYYGNPSVGSQQNPSGVWDSNFLMVQHLEEVSGTRFDSTINGHNGTPYVSVSKHYEGKIDGADTFDGSGGYINITGGFLPADSLTFELWLKPLSFSNSTWRKYLNTGNSTTRGIYGGQSSLTKDLWELSLSWNSGTKKFSTGGQTSNFDWMYVAVTWNGTYACAYYNGLKVREALVNGTPDWTGMPIYLGSNYVGGERFHGIIDETRVSNAARSDDWMLTSYRNQESPNTFYVVGGEESQGGAPFASDENPSNGATDVYTNPVLSVHVVDPEMSPMTVLFETNASGIWENISSYSNVTDGTYSATPTSMTQLGTSYYWGVYVTDGASWTNQTYSFTTTATVLKSKWTAYAPSTEAGVLTADANGDGFEEVFVAGKGSVRSLNGTDGSVLWDVEDARIGTMCQPQISDLNHDGNLEIVVPLESPAGLLVLFANNGSKYWEKDNLGLETYSSPVIADIDGSGYPTIFFASTDVYKGLNGTGRITALSHDGRILRQTFAWRSCGGGLSIGDTDGDGEFELYYGDRFMYEWDAGYGRGLVSLWAKNLTERWSRPDIVLSSHIPMLADVNHDGILDVVAGHIDGGLGVFNSTDGSTFNMAIGIPNDAPVHYQPSVYDIDHDGHLEMLMADGYHNETSDDIVIWDLDTWKIEARMYVGKCFYGPQIADLTGDGNMEIVAANYTGLFIFDSNYSLIAQVTGLDEILNYAVVQDIDGNGYSELIITSHAGKVYAFDTPARRPSPRPRSEVQFYSEYRLGAAEYVPPPGISEPIVTDPNPLSFTENVSVTLKQLDFSLTDYQCDLMNYTVNTYPDIGHDTGINIVNGRYSLLLNNLQYSTTYSWDVTVSDGIHSSSRTYTFTTEPALQWWDTHWGYRKSIKIDHNKVAGNLTNFPVLIEVTDTDLSTKTQTSGSDIVFVGADLNKLDHEIEFYDHGTGHLVAWVRLPFVSSTVGTVLYMYYGNAAASNQQNPAGVWNSDFVMVQHLEETSGTRYDSTANGNNGTPYGTVSKNSTGKIDGADTFDGVSSYENITTRFLPTSAITVELWLKPLSFSNSTWRKYLNTGNSTTRGIYGGQSSLTKDLWELSLTWNSKTTRFATGGRSNFDWIQLAVTWNGTYCYGYLNGAKFGEAAVIGSPDWTDRPLLLGSNCFGSEIFQGILDEVRISDTARSADWILTSYNNQKNSSAFYSLGNESKPSEKPIVAAFSPYDKATSTPVLLSGLSFDLTDYQQDLMNYTVVTFPDVGSGSGINVSNGRYAVAISNLAPSTTYTWLVNVTDGTNWTNQTYTFTTETTLAWWNSSWKYRKAIVIDHTEIDSDLQNFPVLIDVTDGDLVNQTRPDGYDLLFIDNHSNKLDHEIEFYDHGTGHLVAWVRLPFVSSTVGTVLYMYYGNAAASNQQNPAGVWNSDFVMVQHLEETSGTRYDSTANGNNGTPYGTVSKNSTGKIDGADTFDGVGGAVKVDRNFLPTSAITVELWLKPLSFSNSTWRKYLNTGNSTTRGIYGGQSSLTKDLWELSLSWNSGTKKFSTGGQTSNFDWMYVAVTWNGTYACAYYNGLKVREALVNGTPDWTGMPIYLGSNYVGGERFNGIIDEVRISGVARSPNWMLTSYNNQKAPGAFYTMGSQETIPGGIVISAPIPSNDAKKTALSLSQLSFNLVNYENQNVMNYTVVTFPDVGSGSGINVSNGRYAVAISNLAPSTTYTWLVNVTDGTNWTNQTYTFTTYPGNPPTQDAPILLSSGGTNTTGENLVCFNQTTLDRDGCPVTNIYNWCRDGVSTTNLLLAFDTNDSATVRDYSGYDNTGAIAGGVTWTSSGVAGGAYEFNRGYIQIPGAASLDGGGQWIEMTAEEWIYLPTDQWGTRTLAKIPSYEIGVSGTKIFAGVWTDNGVWNITRYHSAFYDAPLEKNKWHHVAFTYKSGEGLKLYIDGLAVATNPLVSGNIQTSGSQPLYVGWFDYFKGKIGEVRIYPKSLSSQQVYQRYLETKDGLTNNSTIVAQETQVGETWGCKVTPNDSYQDGATKTSNTLTITMSQTPTADNLTIYPATPETNDNLTASYIYYDPYGVPENGTEIRWYKNNLLQHALNNTLLVSQTLTTKGDVWFFTVRPSNGTVFGTIQTSAPVQIINSPPTIDSYSPQNTTLQINEGDTVNFTQTSSDLDNDPLTYSWVLDGITQSTAQNWTYAAGFSSAGNHKLILRVSDGSTGDLNTWEIKVINTNRPPQAMNLTINPQKPFTADVLTGNYTYSDPDGDPENGTQIRWYRNSVLQPLLNDSLIVSANQTVKGDEWYFTVKPSDGTDFGTLQASRTLTILNSPPTTSGVSINPNVAYRNDTLAATPTGPFDADGDDITYSYQWQQSQNDTWQDILGATTQTLHLENFSKGAIVQVVCTPYDGQDYGVSQRANLTVSNSPPIITSHYPGTDPDPIFVNQTQEFNLTTYDRDGDTLTIQWYVNGTLTQAWTGNSSVIFQTNVAGTYSINVIVSDGESQTSFLWTLVVMPAGDAH